MDFINAVRDFLIVAGIYFILLECGRFVFSFTKLLNAGRATPDEQIPRENLIGEGEEQYISYV